MARMTDDEAVWDVVVVGAGLSGLRAAQLLREVSPNLRVRVVEASGRLGGRVQDAAGIAPWRVPLGAEFIHGKDNSRLMDLFTRWGWKTRELEWPDKFYFADRKDARDSKGDADAWMEPPKVEDVHDLFAGVCDIDGGRSEADVSLRDVVAGRFGPTDRDALEIAEVCYANDFGTSLARLGLAEMKEEARHWKYGEKYLLLDRSLNEVVDKLAEDLDVVTDWQVRRVDCIPSAHPGAWRCEVTNQRGDRLRCRTLIVTAPLAVLQRGDIRFDPPLPADKRGAMSRVKMGAVMKVVLVFRHRFWPAQFWDACCPFGFLPEIWATTYPSDPTHAPPPSHATGPTIVGFVAGERAERMARMPEREIVTRSLAQLDAMFARSRSNASAFPDPLASPSPPPAPPRTPALYDEAAPASSLYVRHVVKDWSDEKFIGGGYTYPTLGAKKGDRSLLAKPCGPVHFAGEATHEGINPCMQGALETAERCVGEVLAALSSSPSSLSLRGKAVRSRL